MVRVHHSREQINSHDLLEIVENAENWASEVQNNSRGGDVPYVEDVVLLCGALREGNRLLSVGDYLSEDSEDFGIIDTYLGDEGSIFQVYELPNGKNPRGNIRVA